MNFDVGINKCNNGATIAVMAHHQSSEMIGNDLQSNKVAPLPTIRKDYMLKASPEATAKESPPQGDEKASPQLKAAAAATTAAPDNCEEGSDCQESSYIKVADFTGTPAQHDAIFNSKISFPLNLTRMLETVKDKGLAHIVHWSDDNKSFIICDIDLFLTDVLPKFFKSSEKTKIRSFYRKLNRWGFSMARKNAYNPNNIWHHSGFNRASAVKSLNQSLETGKAVDFLNMTAITRGKKRRGGDNTKECEHSYNEDDDSSSNMAMGGSGEDTFDPFHRPAFSQSHNTMGNTSSLPILPSQKSPMITGKKKSRTLSMCTLSSGEHQQQQRNRLLTSSNLLRYSQSVNALGSGVPNNNLNSSSSGGGANATFDLPTTSSSNHTTGVGSYPSLYRNLAPSPNIFAMSAAEMMNVHSPSVSNIGSMGLNRTAQIPGSNTNGVDQSNNNNFSLFAPQAPCQDSLNFGRQLLQSEMTEEEDSELVAFFGNLAKRLPPPKEEDEEGCAAGEPDPLPHNF